MSLMASSIVLRTFIRSLLAHNYVPTLPAFFDDCFLKKMNTIILSSGVAAALPNHPVCRSLSHPCLCFETTNTLSEKDRLLCSVDCLRLCFANRRARTGWC